MKTHLASNIKFLRRMKGMTQSQLAEELGLNRNNIASYETGVVEPQFAILLQLAHFFDLDVSALLTTPFEHDVLDAFEQPSPASETAKKYHSINSDLELFIKSTNNAQKSIDGFKELFTFSRANSKEPNFSLSGLHGDLDNLVDLVSKILNVNWDFIQSLQGRDSKEE